MRSTPVAATSAVALGTPVVAVALGTLAAALYLPDADLWLAFATLASSAGVAAAEVSLLIALSGDSGVSPSDNGGCGSSSSSGSGKGSGYSFSGTWAGSTSISGRTGSSSLSGTGDGTGSFVRLWEQPLLPFFHFGAGSSVLSGIWSGSSPSSS
ncbi:UNVERIFIED_CONTAM: hypothetical protein FKN15_014081 [Acipenser sinensis]